MSPALDPVSEALTNLESAGADLDSATTDHAAELADLVERVKADDLAPGELEAVVTRISDRAAAISTAASALAGFTATAAGVEPRPVVPPEEPPVG